LRTSTRFGIAGASHKHGDATRYGRHAVVRPIASSYPGAAAAQGCRHVYPQSNQIERPMMKQVKLTVPEIGLIAGTRAAAGAGLALLLSNRLNPDQRRAVGWTLLAVGIATTIPLVAQVFGKHCAPAGPEET